MKCQSFFCDMQIKKNVIILSSAEHAHRVVKVKEAILLYMLQVSLADTYSLWFP